MLSISRLCIYFLWFFFFPFTICTAVYRHCRADVSHWTVILANKLQVGFFFLNRVEAYQVAGATQRKGLPITSSHASHHAAVSEKEQAACSSTSPQPGFEKWFQWAGRSRESLELAAMQVGWIILQQMFPLLPPLSAILPLFPPLPSPPCTPTYSLAHPPPPPATTTKTPPLFKIGRSRDLVDKVHTSCEFLIYSLNSSRMKIVLSTLCLFWHPVMSLYQASSLSHFLNIQLSFTPHGVPHLLLST